MRCSLRQLTGTLHLTLELPAPEMILLRPGSRRIAERRRGAQRPLRVREVRPANGHEICPPRRDDRVHLVRLGDVSHGNGRHLTLVSNAVAVRRLEKPPEYRLRTG